MTCFICPMTKEKRCDDGCGLCFNCPGSVAESALSWGAMTEDLVDDEEHGFYVDDEGDYPERGPRRAVR